MRIRSSQAVAVVGVLALLAGSVGAPAAQTFTYPNQGQGPEQQSRDRADCQRWAVQQTGFDPSAVGATPPAPPPPPPPPGTGVGRGAFRGAAVGAVGGAIAGDAGTGAAAGAAMGGLIGGMRTRDQYAAEQQAYQQHVTRTQQAQAARVDAYNRAVNACLAGRGYTVR